MHSISAYLKKYKLIWLSILVIMLQFAVYYALWMNPLVKDISDQFSTHPGVKPYDYFGGVDNWTQLRFVFHVLFLAMLIYLYTRLHNAIPGKGWVKGVNFGLMVSLLKTLPQAFNQWTMINYPNELIVLQLINGVVSLLIFGTLLALLIKNPLLIKNCVD